MNLTRISLPLQAPLRTAQGTLSRRLGVLATMPVDDAVAVAEATPHPDLSQTDPEVLYQSLAGEDVPEPPEASVVREWLALDAQARRRNAPCAALLTAEPSPSVAVNALVGLDGGPDQALAAVRRGHRTVKVKIGPDLDTEVRRLRMIRGAVGPDVRLRADANAAWTADMAVQAVASLAPLGLEYLEDPIPVDADWSRLAGTPVPLAVDDPSPPDQLMRVVDVVVLKPSMMSPRGAMLAAERCRDHGVAVVVTSIIDGAVGVAAALQAAAAVRTPLACGLATSSLLAADVADPPPIRDGSMSLDRPGIGVVLDARRLDQVSVTSFVKRSNG